MTEMSQSWRGGKTSAQRGYSYRWQKARLAHLNRHPLCAECGKSGKVVPASVVDHIIPHRGDQKLFWDRDNWQSLCKRHHDSDKQREEKSGRKILSIGRDGWPEEVGPEQVR